MTQTKATLFYLFDPLCGWCYGASPALRQMAESVGPALTLLPTGLFAGPMPRRLEPDMVSYIKQADQRIAAMTGQIFSTAYQALLEQPGQYIDSTLATLTFGVLARRLPGQTVAILAAIQAARYVGGRDITSQNVLADIAAQFGVPEVDFVAELTNESALAATSALVGQGQAALRRSGRSGVPTVMIAHDGRDMVLNGNVLFGQPQMLAEQLKRFF